MQIYKVVLQYHNIISDIFIKNFTWKWKSVTKEANIETV